VGVVRRGVLHARHTREWGFAISDWVLISNRPQHHVFRRAKFDPTSGVIGVQFWTPIWESTFCAD
jgi:hypothetical protein